MRERVCGLVSAQGVQPSSLSSLATARWTWSKRVVYFSYSRLMPADEKADDDGGIYNSSVISSGRRQNKIKQKQRGEQSIFFFRAAILNRTIPHL